MNSDDRASSLYSNDWKKRFADKLVSADEAIKRVQSGNRVFVDGNAALPAVLIEALARQAGRLENVELNHLLTFGDDPFEKFTGVRHNAWFVGPGARKSVNQGDSDYVPIFLGEINQLFKSKKWPVDVALIQVSPPDRYGFFSYGIEVSITRTAAECATLVIAQVNENMPRTLGDSFIHISDIDCLVEGNQDLVEIPMPELTEVELTIGKIISGLIEDGSTLQLGIGSIPNAVLAALGDKNDLGVHTEMFSDGILPLLESGVINNKKKTLLPGKVVTGFAMGSRNLYDYIDNNPVFEFRPSLFVNDPFIIARNEKMVSINSALQIDLTGQVCADSIGSYIYSGIGGQVDFIRGAARSPGGKPIIAMPSTAKGGKVSRIVPQLTPGAGVVTSRGDVRYVVTEYGWVDLFGKNLAQRARDLISIAHPDFRAELSEGL